MKPVTERTARESVEKSAGEPAGEPIGESSREFTKDFIQSQSPVQGSDQTEPTQPQAQPTQTAATHPNKEFAILTDSGTDTPADIVQNFPVYIVPLQVIYKDKSYLDGVDITPKEVAQSLTAEIPHTALPPLGVIEEKIEEIRTNGYTKIIVVTVSANLSGTFNAMQVAAKDYPEMEFAFVDSKSLGLGAGMLCAFAAHCLEEGKSFEESAALVQQHVLKSKVFFVIPTLKYLAQGGRIGKVAGLLGMALRVVPVITIDDNGEFATVAKFRNWKKAIDFAKQSVANHLAKALSYDLAVADSGAEEEADGIAQELSKRLPLNKHLYRGEISPALVVHVGPRFLGIGGLAL